MSSKRVSYATWQKMTPAQKAAKKRAMARRGIGTVSGKGAYNVNLPDFAPGAPIRKLAGGAYDPKYSYSNPGPWGKAGRLAGGLAGKAIAGPVGGFVGEKLGGLAHYIGRIFGSGDYISSPSVNRNTILSPQIPSFKSGSSTVRIQHREFLGDVISSSTANTFNVNSYSLNPGLSRSFPWLSSVCGSTFQQYRINGMVFEYRSTSSDALNSTNTALGTVIMCTDYDSADQPFTSKQQMENTEFGVSCKPSSNMIHAIECAPRLTTATELYIRAYNNPTGTDIRLYDWGKFYIATNGFQGTNVTCGELWVSYDVTFFKAIEQPPLYIAPSAVYRLQGSSVTAANPLGTVGTQVSLLDQIGMTFTSQQIRWPSTIDVDSIYVISYLVVGASTAITPLAWTSGNGMTYINYFVAPSGGYTNTTYSATLYYRYAGGGTPSALPYVQLMTGTLPSALTDARVTISQISGSFPPAMLPGVA